MAPTWFDMRVVGDPVFSETGPMVLSSRRSNAPSPVRSVGPSGCSQSESSSAISVTADTGKMALEPEKAQNDKPAKVQSPQPPERKNADEDTPSNSSSSKPEVENNLQSAESGKKPFQASEDTKSSTTTGKKTKSAAVQPTKENAPTNQQPDKSTLDKKRSRGAPPSKKPASLGSRKLSSDSDKTSDATVGSTEPKASSPSRKKTGRPSSTKKKQEDSQTMKVKAITKSDKPAPEHQRASNPKPPSPETTTHKEDASNNKRRRSLPKSEMDVNEVSVSQSVSVNSDSTAKTSNPKASGTKQSPAPGFASDTATVSSKRKATDELEDGDSSQKKSFSSAVAKASQAAAEARKNRDASIGIAEDLGKVSKAAATAAQAAMKTCSDGVGREKAYGTEPASRFPASKPNSSPLPASLGMLAELAEARVLQAPIIPKSERSDAESGANEEPPRRTDSSESSGMTVMAPSPKSRRKPSLSTRGFSDASGDSIHRAGTPKSHNMLSATSDDKSRRSRMHPGGPALPELKEDTAEDGLGDDRLAMPCLSRPEEDQPKVLHLKPNMEKDDHKVPLKRPAETTMEPPKSLKRQRSVGGRPPSIISQRQRSTGSRLSFADEVQIAGPGTQSNGGNKLKAPPVLRKNDRQQSWESLQPPSVILGGDRQSSIGSYASLKSLTPNSRLTPNALGHGNSSPNTDTPNTARMEDLYNQLDQYMESPSQSLAGSPGQRALPFRPRAMTQRQSSTASIGLDSQGDLKLPSVNGSELESEADAESVKTGASGPNQKGAPTDRAPFRSRGGLGPLQIPTDSEINNSAPVTTPTSQMRSPRGAFSGAEQADTNQSRRKQSPQERFQRGGGGGSGGQLPKSQSPQQSAKGDRVRPAPMQGDSLQAWLQGTGGNAGGMGLDQLGALPPPRVRSLPQGPPGGPGPRSISMPNQSQQFPFPYGMAGAGYDARSRMNGGQPQNKPYDRRQLSFDSVATYKTRNPPAPSAYGGYAPPPRNGFPPNPPLEQRVVDRRPDVSQLRRKKIVEFGHPREEVVEAQRIYSRHTLLLWGAHKSDICPVNGNQKDGCDSLIYVNEGGDVPRTKDDLMFLQFKCSQRNGGAALFCNYQKSQHRDAPHSYPVRVFRKTVTASGLSGLRYDGLYHVAAIHDDRGRPRSEPSNTSKTFSFLLKRNRAGQAGEHNRYMLEELWEVVQQGRETSPPQQDRRGPPAPSSSPLHVPPLVHGGQRGVSFQAPLQHSPPSFQQQQQGGGGHQFSHHQHQQQHPQLLKAPSAAGASLLHNRYGAYGDRGGMPPQHLPQAGHPMSLAQQRSQSMPVQPWAPHHPMR